MWIYDRGEMHIISENWLHVKNARYDVIFLVWSLIQGI